MSVLVQKRLFTVDDYYRMAQAGILREDDRVELIEGEIVQMTPIGSRHAGCVKYLSQMFHSFFGKKAVVSTQDPIYIDLHNEPQPDICVVRSRSDFYRNSHPNPSEVFFIVEVADSSQEYDRRQKIPLYGRNGIPETWLVDIANKRIEVYRDPSENGYRECIVLEPGQSVSPRAFPELLIPVSEILG